MRHHQVLCLPVNCRGMKYSSFPYRRPQNVYPPQADALWDDGIGSWWERSRIIFVLAEAMGLRPNLQLPISRQAGGLFYGTCLLMSYFHQHTCSWHLYLLEKNNYSLGDLSHDTCRCAYAIGSLHTTNITTRYVCDLFLMNYFHKRTCGRHEIFSPARVNPCTQYHT